MFLNEFVSKYVVDHRCWPANYENQPIPNLFVNDITNTSSNPTNQEIGKSNQISISF